MQENQNERIMDSLSTRYMRATMEIVVPLSSHILVNFFFQVPKVTSDSQQVKKPHLQHVSKFP